MATGSNGDNPAKSELDMKLDLLMERLAIKFDDMNRRLDNMEDGKINTYRSKY